MTSSEGYVPFKGYKTWYRVVGEGDVEGKLPVLLLHGGPGGTHDYLESLEALAETGRRAIFYDQLGCGRSDLPEDTSLFTVETFVEEVGEVRGALGLDRIHLFGSSWGGMLAMEYALTQPQGLASLILASSPSSIPQWVEETAKLRAQLPEDVQATLRKHEEAGTTDDPEYEEACMPFYKRHVCRLDEWPDSVLRSFKFLAEHGLVYRHMNGPSEFHVTGTLRNWDVTGRLGEIHVPTLVVTGEHDEATPAINRTVSGAIPGAESVVYPGGSHMAHVEDTEGYVTLLDDFMNRVESGAREPVETRESGASIPETR
jgi:proline-specific peptidase